MVVIPLPGSVVETVILRGHSKSIVRAEEMLGELLSSSQEIFLSFEFEFELFSGIQVHYMHMICDVLTQAINL